ncbi:DUF805 domain-containing protein [Polaromonas sp. A23]|uniref:DUF805 domain-containing protein n=1 Tax=Polaromonas sp. A23 TaxID=1944133 RepID=UPI0009844C9A|nr:DUF805 domain-containing protein [Polaromonas sp. A23]OOG45098.1 hypothetical protein B0B52_05005 [Polaromonas sp. A23]
MKSFQFFNAAGRLSRAGFWLHGLVVWVVFYLAWSVLGNPAAGAAVWLINVPALAALGLLCIRRLHDRNYSGWWLLLVVVPVAGALWLFWQTAVRRGVAQDNRWGVDPLQSRADYLVVR